MILLSLLLNLNFAFAQTAPANKMPEDRKVGAPPVHTATAATVQGAVVVDPTPVKAEELKAKPETPSTVGADGLRIYTIELKNRTMSPSEIRVKAGEPFWLEVKNTDGTSEEIESNSFKFEKVIPPKRTAKIKVGKTAPGIYDIFGEFHADTCQGKIIAE